MIEFILFISVCLLYQSIKNAFRGPKKTTVSLRRPKSKQAECGCMIEDDHVFKCCSAHRIMLNVSQE